MYRSALIWGCFQCVLLNASCDDSPDKVAGRRPKETLAAGATALQQQRYREAIDLFTEGLQGEISSEARLEVLFLRALAYGGAEEEKQSLADLNSLLESHPRASLAAKAFMIRAQLYNRWCQPRQGLRDAESAVQSQPEVPDVYRCRAMIQLRYFGRYEEAMTDYKKAVEVSRSLRGENSKLELARAYGELGEKHFLLHQIEAASVDFEHSLQSLPLASVYAGRARLRLEQGDYKRAKADMEEALKIEASNRDAIEALGQLALCEGREEDAKKWFAKAGKTIPLALLTYSQGDRLNALSNMQQLAVATPCAWEATEVYGMCLYAVGRVADARQELQKAVTMQSVPDLSWAIFLLAATGNNDQKDVVSRLWKVTEKFPQDLWAGQLMSLAAGGHNLEQTLKAAQLGGLQMNSQRKAEALYVAGELELLRGRRDLAEGYFLDATKLSGPYSEVHTLAGARLNEGKHLPQNKE